MKLTGQQYKQLADALIDGFDLRSLERMLRVELNQRLDEIVSGQATIKDAVHAVVSWAERNDRVDDLIAGAKAANPTNSGIVGLPDSFDANPAPASEPGTNPTPSGLNDVRARRLRDLEKHLAEDTELLRQFEEQLRDEDDPRRLRKIQREIDRQKASIASYTAEHDELAAGMTAETGSEASVAINAVGDQITGLRQQITGMEARLTAQHEQTRTQMSAQQDKILARIDAGQRQTVAAVTARLDAHQLETVDLLYDVVDQQQIAHWEAENTANMVRHALVELSKQPDAAQWQQLLDAIDSDSEWQQKLKLTIPIIPTILELESEVALDVLPALREKWQQLVAKVKR